MKYKELYAITINDNLVIERNKHFILKVKLNAIEKANKLKRIYKDKEIKIITYSVKDERTI
jgi:hypothetical protein